MHVQRDLADDFAVGRGLVFVLGAFRSGTTLVRKMLDSHSQVCSPAETWFLLPLVNMWEGVGECAVYKPAQAAAAVRSHVSREQFVECCRAFAGRFYASILRPGKRVMVDKTPPYLPMAGALPTMFPEAKFVVLARDPRGILWSRHTWRHADDASLESRVGGVASDVKRLAGFAEQHRCHVVRYEDVCCKAEGTMRGLCAAIGVEYEAGMIRYGACSHHEGYGDENTRAHVQPHEGSVARWELTREVEGLLMDKCGGDALSRLGYGGLKAA